MLKHLAAARESVACLPDSKERAAALQSIRCAQDACADVPADPAAFKVANEAYIQSLEQRVKLAEDSEAYLLRACSNLQSQVAAMWRDRGEEPPKPVTVAT